MAGPHDNDQVLASRRLQNLILASLAAGVVDLAALEVLATAANVDLAALEVLVTAGNVDLAALEVLQTATNTATEKGGKGNSNAPATVTKVNATAIVDTTSVDSVALVASTTPYITATVHGRTASADANTISTPNTDDVYILTTNDDLRTAMGPIAPGQSYDLPDNCDLVDFFLAVKVATEGVLITYTV